MNETPLADAPKAPRKGAANRSPITSDWVAKSLAGALLGLSLALIASAALSDLTASLPLLVRAQLAMWLVPPIWLGILGSVYFFSNGRRAWIWLGGSNALAFGTLWVLRSMA